MILDVAILRHPRVKLLVPFCVILLLGYGDFAAFYSLGYQEIWKYHSKGNAIALWTLLVFFQIAIFVYWAAILTVGPGKSPTFVPFNLYNIDDPTLSTTPEVFVSDELGFPFFNSQTNSIAINRTFYLKDTNYNVLKFDHYCVWIGCVIGETNYVFFLKFLVCLLSIFVIVLGHLIKFVPSNTHRGEINHNFIILFVLCGFWILMITILLVSHLRYVCLNITTLDEITISQRKAYLRWESRKNTNRGRRNFPRVEHGKRYVNIKRDDNRYVVEYDVNERPYTMGMQANWINLIFNGNRNHGGKYQYTTSRFIAALIIFAIPFVDIPFVLKCRHRPIIGAEMGNEAERRRMEFESFSSRFSPEFVKLLNEKIDRNECQVPIYMKPEERTESDVSESSTSAQVADKDGNAVGRP
ncbi:Palmitoyltransferase PFA5 [Suhomyces tanzawaensis NRRL Y-17324]|uniref:Palmitoyltransferase n=1 Tax=Suhomyces tanzawaensis NRRL Y-17324 TaxID=984487 RepID=A0A1E4SQ83_9ASCO|nr:Palmitoyltransferase PFA5 [Suhomyces tanzawaensis NRRL Y-17324]ODV81658.1 Palmitoyltransferase PFA5 [Suhomyces tanzawaensis NRRL Y-17324]